MYDNNLYDNKGKGIVDLYSASTRSVSKALSYSTQFQGITVLPAHPAFHPQVE